MATQPSPMTVRRLTDSELFERRGEIEALKLAYKRVTDAYAQRMLEICELELRIEQLLARDEA